MKIIGFFAFLWSTLTQHYYSSSLTIERLFLPYVCPGSITKEMFALLRILKTSLDSYSGKVFSSVLIVTMVFSDCHCSANLLNAWDTQTTGVLLSHPILMYGIILGQLWENNTSHHNSLAYWHCTCFWIINGHL